MQDIQNIPNPDVNSVENDEDFGNHSDVHPDSLPDDNLPEGDIESPDDNIPLPPDSRPNAPVEEPPGENDKAPINENGAHPQQLV